MATNWYNRDVWVDAEPNIYHRMEAIDRALQNGPILVAHHHFYGASGPSTMVFDDEDSTGLREYIARFAQPGDAFMVWDVYLLTCEKPCFVTEGKVPDGRGLVPSGGAY